MLLVTPGKWEQLPGKLQHFRDDRGDIRQLHPARSWPPTAASSSLRRYEIIRHEEWADASLRLSYALQKSEVLRCVVLPAPAKSELV